MIIIRADGNAKIGAGHLMRCLTIGEALAKKLGTFRDICFVCADEQSAAMASEAGFPTKVLGTDYRDMESELPYWEQLVQEGGPQAQNRILVDSYYVTDVYLQRLKTFGKLYLLDDLQEHAYPADVVINYNAFADVEVYRELYRGTETECLVGSAYVPIRSQFLHCEYEVASEVSSVLITTGGGDKDNIAGAILERIYREGTELRDVNCHDVNFHDVNFHIVTGRYNPNLEALKQIESTRRNVHIHHDVTDMAGLMKKCDIAVTAGGTTIYELASIGVPFLCFSYAKNQEALTSYIGNKEIAGFAGAYHLDREQMLTRLEMLFAQYCRDAELRQRCFRREREMIDGKGAERIAEKLM